MWFVVFATINNDCMFLSRDFPLQLPTEIIEINHFYAERREL